MTSTTRSLLLIAIVFCFLGTTLASTTPAFHNSTNWKLSTSLKFDVLCALNVLTGDPYYLKYYGTDYERLNRKLTPEARSALADLKYRLKDVHGQIISAFLTLYFSAADGDTLDDMIRTVDDSRSMKRNLQNTPYYSDSGWQLYEGVRDDLRTIFRELKKVQFDSDWRQNILPKEQLRIRELSGELSKQNIVPRIEKLLGTPLASDEITVYVLYYAQPHGIKITGTRFLTDVAWPSRIVLRNAVHEMMHPPFDLRRDKGVRAAISTLETDPLIKEKFEQHNASFGYNSLDGLVEEDCVQALEQLINEELGVAVDARKRWQESDDGMHVLAVALYELMKQEKFGSGAEAFPAFLNRMAETGRLSPGKIRKEYDAFYGTSGAAPSN